MSNSPNPSVLPMGRDMVEFPQTDDEKAVINSPAFREQIKNEIAQYLKSYLSNQKLQIDRLEKLEKLVNQEVKKNKEATKEFSEDFSRFKEQIRLGMWNIMQKEKSLTEEFDNYKNQLKKILSLENQEDFENLTKSLSKYTKKITDLERRLVNLDTSSIKDEFLAFKNQIKEVLDKHVKAELEKLNKHQAENFKRLQEAESLIAASMNAEIKLKRPVKDMKEMKSQIHEMVQAELNHLAEIQSETRQRITEIEQFVQTMNPNGCSAEEFNEFKKQITEIIEDQVQADLLKLLKLQSENFRRLKNLEKDISSKSAPEELQALKTQIKEEIEEDLKSDIKKLASLREKISQRMINLNRDASTAVPEVSSEQLDRLRSDIKEIIEKQIMVYIENVREFQIDQEERISRIEQSMTTTDTNTTNLENGQQLREELVEGIRLIGKRVTKAVQEMDERFQEFTQQIENKVASEKKPSETINPESGFSVIKESTILDSNNFEVVPKSSIDRITQLFKKQSEGIKQFIDEQQSKVFELEALLKQYDQENSKLIEILSQKTKRNFRIAIIGIVAFVVLLIIFKLV